MLLARSAPLCSGGCPPPPAPTPGGPTGRGARYSRKGSCSRSERRSAGGGAAHSPGPWRHRTGTARRPRSAGPGQPGARKTGEVNAGRQQPPPSPGGHRELHGDGQVPPLPPRSPGWGPGIPHRLWRPQAGVTGRTGLLSAGPSARSLRPAPSRSPASSWALALTLRPPSIPRPVMSPSCFGPSEATSHPRTTSDPEVGSRESVKAVPAWIPP